MSPFKTAFTSDKLEQDIKETGLQIFKDAESVKTGSVFNKDWWYGKIMDWSMKNEAFKVKMFRFVDVLPYLTSSSDVLCHLKEYFSENEHGEKDKLPSIFQMGVGVGNLAPGLAAKGIRKNVEQMAKIFITGEDPKSALPVLKKQRKNNLTFTVDLLGEATLSEKEALDYQNRYLELTDWLVKDTQSWSENTQLDTDSLGDLPRVNVSVKLSSLYSQINPKDWERSIEILLKKIDPIISKAQASNVFINIDMESYEHKDLTLEVFKRLILSAKYKDYPHLGIVIQAYLRDSYQDLQNLIQTVKERGTPVTIRLVKGAYWDYETIHAQQNDWPIPVYTNKKESDANYETCAQLLLDNYPHIKLALGSHNIRSISYAISYAEHINLPKNAFEIQMLYGMADSFKLALAKKGFRVREYATVGELIPGMAYLVRRLLENTSNESFLRSKFADKVSTEKLLSNPAHELKTTPSTLTRKYDFYNESPLDFTLPSHRQKVQDALTNIQSDLGKKIPLVIGQKEIQTEKTLSRENPSNTKELVTEFYLATNKEADLALQKAKDAFSSWRFTPAKERAQLVDKLADNILTNRYKWIALIVKEVGKPWAEADADVCEAIDFCRYYAADMRKLNQPRKVGHAPGEETLYHYQPRGVALVIAPWNFPLAILTGMVSASLVTGNTVIMKPAEQSTLVAYHLMKAITDVGFPADVISYEIASATAVHVIVGV